MDFWPTWLRPVWLLLLPLLVLLVWKLWHRQRRLGRWQTLLPEPFHTALLTGGNGQAGRLRWVVLGLAWLLGLLALLGPSWERLEQPDYKPEAPLVVILELTPRMLATDASPNRLEQARRKLLDLLEVRRDAQTALVVYAGSAHTLVPLSNDLVTTANLLEAIKPSIMPEPGQRADLAVARALELLDRGSLGKGRLLLISSGLDTTEQAGVRALLDTRDEPLDVLGIGSRQGAPIRGEDGELLKDDQGAILLPRLDAAGLRALAEALRGQYRALRIDDADLRQLGLLDTGAAVQDSGETRLLDYWADQGHWLLLPLLLLAACAGRRGWLFGLALVIFSPPSQAFTFEDLWLRRDQQGQQLLEAQRPAEAARRFVDPQRQGQALYEAGDYQSAAERFALDDSAVGHYNRGNALARSDQLEAALDAYDQALERHPDFPQARRNRALVEELLRQRQQQDLQQPEQKPEPQPQPQPDAAQGGRSELDSAQNEQNSQNGKGDGEAEENSPTPSSNGSEQPQDKPTEQPAETADSAAEPPDEPEQERMQAREQWLRQIPDDPAELLRRKFWYQQQQRQEQTR